MFILFSAVNNGKGSLLNVDRLEIDFSFPGANLHLQVLIRMSWKIEAITYSVLILADWSLLANKVSNSNNQTTVSGHLTILFLILSRGRDWKFLVVLNKAPAEVSGCLANIWPPRNFVMVLILEQSLDFEKKLLKWHRRDVGILINTEFLFVQILHAWQQIWRIISHYSF